jgi:hypothetical protein
MLTSDSTVITVNRSGTHLYLPIKMVIDEHEVHLDTIAYIDKCLGRRIVKRPATSLATEDLLL